VTTIPFSSLLIDVIAPSYTVEPKSPQTFVPTLKPATFALSFAAFSFAAFSFAAFSFAAFSFAAFSFAAFSFAADYYTERCQKQNKIKRRHE